MEHFLNDLWAALRDASPIGAMLCGVFLYLARRDLSNERKGWAIERKVLQDDLTAERGARDALLERSLTSINAAGVAVGAATAIVGDIRGIMGTLVMEVKLLTHRDPGE